MYTKSFFTLTAIILLLLHTSVCLYAQSNDCTSTIHDIELNETKLHYLECGEGEPVVFVHGSTGDLNSLSEHAQLLAPEFRTISYSRRFHFPNDTPQADDIYSLQQHANDLSALIRELDLGPVHLIGHSYGAYVSLAFAVEHPNLVRSLVLGEPPVLPLLNQTSVGEALLESFQKRVIIPARQAYEQGHIEEGLRRFLNGVIYEGWFENLPPNAQDEIVEKAGPEHRLELMTESGVVMYPIPCNALTMLNHPTLLLTGEESPAMFYLITAELEECLEDESLLMVPETGHGMFSNAPFTSDAIKTFLTSH